MELYYGEKIKKFRAENGLTQENFSNQLDISASMLGMIEQGTRKPNERIQEKILNLTGISYYDETIKQIKKEIRDITFNYIASNSTSFTPKNVTKLVDALKDLYDTIDDTSNTKIENYLSANGNDNIQLMTYNLINLLKKYKRESIYNIKNIFYTDANFIKHCIPVIVSVLRNSSSLIYKNREIPLYRGKLPFDIKSNTIKELLSENYFPDKNKFAYVIQDDDMFPKYQKGYTVIAMECDEKNTSGDVILSINNSTPILRKVSFKNNSVIVEAYNSKVETELYSKDEIRILGQIIEIRFFKTNSN